jgi:hypothetical protein
MTAAGDQVKQLDILVVPPQLINDPLNYHSFVSTRCFIQQHLLPPPENIYERDFAVIGVLGTDYTTHEPIRKALEALWIPYQVGYPTFYLIVQCLAKTWRKPVTVTIKNQNGLKHRALRLNSTQKPAKINLPTSSRLPSRHQPVVRQTLVNNPNPPSSRQVAAASISIGHGKNKDCTASKSTTTDPTLASDRGLSSKRDSNSGTPKPSKETNRLLTSKTPSHLSPHQSGEASRQGSPQRPCTLNVTAFPLKRGGVSISQPARKRKLNPEGIESSVTLDFTVLSTSSQTPSSAGTGQTETTRSTVDLTSPASSPKPIEIQHPQIPRTIVDLTTPTNSPRTVRDKQSKRTKVIDDPTPTKILLVIGSTAALPFQLPRSANKTIPLSVQSLKDLTGRLLCARHCGRANDWHHLWHISSHQKVSPAGIRYYQVFFDGQLVLGIRLILLEGEFDPSLKLCAYGCSRDGTVQWITSSRLVFLFLHFVLIVSSQQVGHQRPGGPISPPCPKCPRALVARDRAEFCAPRNIGDLNGIDVYFRSL